MKSYSLRLRLLIGAAVAIFVALSLAWLGMTYIFSRHIERGAEADLRRDATQIVVGVTLAPGGGFDVDPAPGDRRFTTPASGLYWQASTAGIVRRSRSLWDQQIDRHSPARGTGWSLRKMRGPFERELLVIERRVQPDPRYPSVLVQVGQDSAALHTSQEEFGRELAAFLVMLWFVLSLAAWFQVDLGLRALRRLRADVMGLKRRPDERLSALYPSEIAPVIEAINELAEARAGDVRRARQRAADMAHAMKTPIAALSAQSRQLGEIDPVAAEGLDRAIASVAAAVEAELARSRAAATRGSERAALACPAQVCRRLVAVLERTEKGMRTDFDVQIDDALHLRLDAADLTEILGAIIENAAHFARRTVRIIGEQRGEGGCLWIEDDGPGLSPQEALQVLARGTRLDERGGGHGLGLSIAQDMVEATEGVLTLGRAAIGGLRVELCWQD